MKKLLLIALACLFFTSPALAEPVPLFRFDFLSVKSVFDGSKLEAFVNAGKTSGFVESATDSAIFNSKQWTTGLGNFWLKMDITSITPETANGVGHFTIMDMEGDTIKGDLSGQWAPFGTGTNARNTFDGKLSNVVFDDTTSSDNDFSGHFGKVPMSFGDGPWSGDLLEFSVTSKWFMDGPFAADRGSVHGSVVPLPAAVLVGLFGMGVTALKLRKYV